MSHVRKPRQMQLMCDGDRLSRSVSMLAQDQVRLAPTRIVALERVWPMQKYDHIGILFQAVMRCNPLCHKVIRCRHSSVVNVVLTDAGDLHDLVPEHIVGRQVMNRTVFQHCSHLMQSRATGRVLPHCRSAVFRAHRICEGALGYLVALQRFPDPHPHFARYRIGTAPSFTLRQLLQYLFYFDTAGTVYANGAQEPRLIFATINVQVPAVVVTGLSDRRDA